MNGRKRSFLAAVGVMSIAASMVLTGCGGGGGGGSLSPTPDPLKVGLLHWWKLDGDAKDAIGTLNGTIQGPVQFPNTKSGARMLGNGLTTGITIPAVADMQFQGSFTLSAWVQTPTGAPNGHIWEAIFFDGDDRNGLDPYFLMVDPSGQLQFLVRGSTDAYAVNTPMPLNKFVLVTGTYNKVTGALSLYLDGVLAGETSAPAGTPVQTLDPDSLPGVGLGCNNSFPNSGFNFSWNGAIDDMRVYNRALSATEVKSLYVLDSTTL